MVKHLFDVIYCANATTVARVLATPSSVVQHNTYVGGIHLLDSKTSELEMICAEQVLEFVGLPSGLKLAAASADGSIRAVDGRWALQIRL